MKLRSALAAVAAGNDSPDHIAKFLISSLPDEIRAALLTIADIENRRRDAL